MTSVKSGVANFNKKNSIVKSETQVTNAAKQSFMEGFLMFSPMIMPRPVSAPTSCFVSQRSIIVEGNPNDTLALTFCMIPDIMTSALYWVNTNMTDLYYSTNLQLVKHSSYSLPTTSLRSEVGTISTVPFFSNVANNQVHLQRVKNAIGVRSFYSDFRDTSEMITGINSAAYYNKNKEVETKVAATLTIQGAAIGSPEVQLIWYQGRDLNGDIDPHIIPAVASGAGQWSYNINHTNTTAGSFTVMISGLVQVDAIAWSPAVIDDVVVNPSVRYYDTVPNIITDVDPNDMEQWRTITASAEAWATTGSAITLTNQSSNLLTSGSCAIALFPSSYGRLNAINSEVTAAVAARRYTKYVGEALTGCHGIWAPKNVSELMPQEIYSRSNSQFVLGAYTFSGVGAQQVKITLSTRKELITNSTLVTTRFSPHSVTAMAHLFAAMSLHMNRLYGCNSDHLKRIKDTAKNIVTSEPMKQFFKDVGTGFLKTALTLAPLVFI